MDIPLQHLALQLLIVLIEVFSYDDRNVQSVHLLSIFFTNCKLLWIKAGVSEPFTILEGIGTGLFLSNQVFGIGDIIQHIVAFQIFSSTLRTLQGSEYSPHVLTDLRGCLRWRKQRIFRRRQTAFLDRSRPGSAPDTCGCLPLAGKPLYTLPEHTTRQTTSSAINRSSQNIFSSAVII